jgi:hypothetical protein
MQIAEFFKFIASIPGLQVSYALVHPCFSFEAACS